MKIILFFLLISLAFLTTVSAQSGRRVQTAPATPTATPQVRQTQDSTTGSLTDSVGYSESSPNSPRPLSTKTRNEKVSKTDSKKKANTQQPQVTTDSQQPADENDEVIKVETNLVTLPVSVSDRNGFYVADLHQPDFKIFENGIEQKIEYFGTSDQPFTVVLLIDVSPSTSYKIEEIQAAATAFVEQLQPQDQVMVIEFDSSVHVLTEITGDRDKITKAIRKTGFGNGTSLYDAVDFSLRKRLDKIEGRKAIVLFTDGVDTSSGRSSFESTVKDAEESEAIIFPIYYNTFLNTIGIGGGGGVMSTPPTLGLPGGIGGGQSNASLGAEYARGRAYLTQLAAATGGKVYRAESTPGGLSAAFESIAEELRRQYVIGYYPSANGAAGERRQLRVRVNRPKLIIRSRDSYIVGGTGKS